MSKKNPGVSTAALAASSPALAALGGSLVAPGSALGVIAPPEPGDASFPATAGELAAIGRADAAEKALADLQRDVATIEVQRDELTVELGKVRGELEEKDKLAARIPELEGERDGLAAALATARSELEEKAKRLDALADLEGRVGELEGKLADAEKAKGKAEKSAASAKAELQRLPKEVKARPIDGDGEADPEKVKTAMECGEPLSIVFSDGKRELIELEPIGCDASHFTRSGGTFPRYVLRDPVLLHGVSRDTFVDGVALFVGKELIKYTRFAGGRIRVPVGSTVKLEKAITF